MLKKRKAKPELAVASSEQCFWLRNGRVLCSLIDLRDALGEMTDDDFAYHVNKEKNDFAGWVEDILGDATLARHLKKLKTRQGFLNKTSARLKKYYKA